MNMQPEFQKRRQQLFSNLPTNSIAIIPGAILKMRNGDCHYPFRQNSDFYYLTGFDEPNAVAVFIKEQHTSSFILFNQAKDKQQEIWNGTIIGQQDAVSYFGADQSYDIKKLDELLKKLISDKEYLYYPFSNKQFGHKFIHYSIKLPSNIADIATVIANMRLIKSPQEITLMQQAIDLSCVAHKNLIQACATANFEHELEAVFTSHCINNGARFMAYPPIVASGKNACTLHYIKNNEKITKGDLVLVDAGCEWQYYAADITRMFATSGKFTQQQKDIYELVLAAQLAGIAEVYPGNSFDKVQLKILDILIPGLINLKLLSGSKAQIIKEQAYKKFYMHNSGHWLGLDVHDVGSVKVDNKYRNFEPGMVLTVEPGLYIDNLNLGIRIEDDILVTETGNTVMSADAPKAIKDLEF